MSGNVIDASIYENVDLLPLDLRGWNGLSFIFELLISDVRPKQIIEVGTWKGQSAINMGKIIKKLGLDTKIICVDTWLGAGEFWQSYTSDDSRDLLLKNGYPQVYFQFISNVVHTNLIDVILPFPTTSLIASRYFKSNKITADLIYIDASHDYQDVYLDLIAYYDILNENGIIFGDDYSWPGLADAVKKFCQEKNLDYELMDNDQFWVIKKHN